MSDLKPCHCGERKDIFISQRDVEDREGTPMAVCCGACGIVGPWAYCRDPKTPHEAEAAWNEHGRASECAAGPWVYDRSKWDKIIKEGWYLVLYDDDEINLYMLPAAVEQAGAVAIARVNVEGKP